MFVTRNRAGVCAILLLVVFVTACGPPGPRALLRGRESLEAGETDKALKDLKAAVSFLPTNAAAWNYVGLAYHRAGQSTNAIEAYSRAIKLDRDLLEARFNLGCLLLEENRFEAAKTELTAYTLRRGNEPEGWLKLGLVHLRVKEASSAEKCFREVLRLETNNVQALNGLGLAQLQRNRPREAEETFTDALRLQPDYRPALLNLATLLHQQRNNRPEGLRRYREYLALQPRAADWEEVNAVVRGLEQPLAAAPTRTVTNNVASNAAPALVSVTNQSRTLTQQLVATRPQPILKPTSNGVVAKQIPVATNMTASNVAEPPPDIVRRTPEPVIKPLALEPKSSVSRSNSNLQIGAQPTNSLTPKVERRGFLSKLNPFKGDSKSSSNSQVVTGSVASAASLTNSISASGLSGTAMKTGGRRDAETALSQGQQAQRSGRDAEALQFFRRATELDPTYFEGYYCLGLAAFKMRSFQASQGAWQSALALRPNDPDARYNLALTLKAANHPQDAARELEKLLSLHPDEARAHLTLGNLYAEPLRDIARARKHYNKVLQLDPRNPQAQAIRYWLVANPG